MPWAQAPNKNGQIRGFLRRLNCSADFGVPPGSLCLRAPRLNFQRQAGIVARPSIGAGFVVQRHQQIIQACRTWAECNTPLGIGHDSRFALVFTIVKIALARGSELLAIGYDDDARVAAAARHRSDYARPRPCRRYENLQNTPAAL